METGKKPKQKRRVWSKVEEEALLDILDEVVEQGWRCDTGNFKSGTLLYIQKTLNGKVPNCGLRATPHIESKLRKLKKQYNLITNALKWSGFGWNSVKQCLEVDNEEVWMSYVQENKDAKELRDKPFPMFERLGNIFGKDRATGETARTPAELMEEAQGHNDDDDDIDMDGISSITPIQQIPSAQQTSPTRRKRARKEDSITSAFKKVFMSMQQYLDQSAQRMEKISQSMVADKQEVRDIHQEGKDMAEELDRMGYSSFLKIKILKLIVRKQENVVVFNSLTGDDRRLFVEQLLEESSNAED